MPGLEGALPEPKRAVFYCLQQLTHSCPSCRCPLSCQPVSLPPPHTHACTRAQQKIMHTQVRSRVGVKVTPDGRKVRFLKKTGEELPEKSFKQAAPAEDSSSSEGGSSAAPAGGDGSSA